MMVARRGVEGFHPQDIVTGADFLDRRDEVKALRKRMDLGQNTLVLAPRRFGKSSLIQESFRRLRGATCLYVDLYPATSEREAAEAILAQLYRESEKRGKRLLSWLTDLLTRIGVVLRHAPTGLELQFTTRRREREDLVDALMALESYAEKQDRPVVVALDEFQRVLDWRDSEQAIAAMRSVLQQQKRTTYVLSGSKKHVLVGLVSDPGQPFWQQLDVLEIGGIGIEDFEGYAAARFSEHGKRLSRECLARVGAWCRDNPKRIQELLQGVLMEDAQPTPALVDQVALAQVRAHQHLLRSLLDQVTAMNQVRLLKALARHEEEESAMIFSAAFVAEARLGSASNVRTALAGLVDAGILDAQHRFTDPYLKLHLAPPRSGEPGGS